jgi:probable F420-dependent oxidoreductase
MANIKFGFIPMEGGAFYAEFLEEVLYGEELGFDSVWLEEHHGVKDHYWPSPLIGLAGAVTRTQRLLLGTDVLVMPFYHPVRVAEDMALLQIMSGGRMILGTAIGYKPDEFTLYQVAMDKRGERFEEAIRLIRALWTQPRVDFEGRHYQVRGLALEPRPDPAPPIWVGGWGELALARAARYGDAWVPGPTADMEKLLQARDSYHDRLQEIGVSPTSRAAPLTREVVIAKSDDEALAMAEKHVLINYRDEYGGGQWKHPLIGSRDSTVVDRLDTIGRDRFLIGSPATVRAELQRFVGAFGLDHLICRLYFPGIPHSFILRELELLAQEVFPAFR